MRRLKIFFTLLISFFSIFIFSGRTELTPKTFAKKVFYLFPKEIASLLVKKIANFSEPIAKMTLSKEKTIKEKLYYNGEEFEVLIDPSIELSQEKIKFLYEFYKLVNKNNQ